MHIVICVHLNATPILLYPGFYNIETSLNIHCINCVSKTVYHITFENNIFHDGFIDFLGKNNWSEEEGYTPDKPS